MTNDIFRETNLLSARFCAIALMLAVVLASSPAQADPQSKYRAFYYDAQSRLLQVEEVPDGEIETRKLVDIDDSVMPVPMLTERSVPLISGTNVPMSRFAVMAVYYTFDQESETPARVPTTFQVLRRVLNTLASSRSARSPHVHPSPPPIHASSRSAAIARLPPAAATSSLCTWPALTEEESPYAAFQAIDLNGLPCYGSASADQGDCSVGFDAGSCADKRECGPHYLSGFAGRRSTSDGAAPGYGEVAAEPGSAGRHKHRH